MNACRVVPRDATVFQGMHWSGFGVYPDWNSDANDLRFRFIPPQNTRDHV
jgi:hypothetical protein